MQAVVISAVVEEEKNRSIGGIAGNNAGAVLSCCETVMTAAAEMLISRDGKNEAVMLLSLVLANALERAEKKKFHVVEESAAKA